MANPRPNLENLEKGRGKKPKLGHNAYSIKLSPADKETLEALAHNFNCIYAGKGSISGLLAEIAKGSLMITETPPNLKPYLQPTLGNSLLDDDPINALNEQVLESVKNVEQENVNDYSMEVNSPISSYLNS